jgi:hypothetical protein
VSSSQSLLLAEQAWELELSFLVHCLPLRKLLVLSHSQVLQGV